MVLPKKELLMHLSAHVFFPNPPSPLCPPKKEKETSKICESPPSKSFLTEQINELKKHQFDVITLRLLYGDYSYQLMLDFARTGMVELIRDLNRTFGVPVDIPVNGEVPLSAAIKEEKFKSAEMLIFLGASVDQKNGEGLGPLHIAAQKGWSAMCEVLLTSQADPNLKSSKGWTPLHYAVGNGHHESITLLMRNGADPALFSDEGWTPLHVAAMREDRIATKILCENRADVTAVDKTKGVSPVHLAAERGCLTLIEIFREKKADFHIPNIDGETPLYLAVKNKHVETAKHLLTYLRYVGNSPDNQPPLLHLGVETGDRQLVEDLIKKRAIVNCTDFKKATPLHIATKNGNIPIVELLLDNRAKRRSKDANGLTPKDLALKKNYTQIVKLLTSSSPTEPFSQFGHLVWGGKKES